jgi:hypothetical protein
MSDNLNANQKIEILKFALEERYSSIHIIRKRVEDICLWSLGLLLAASGWLTQSNIVLNIFDRIIYILFAIVVYVALRCFYLKNLEHGFRKQLQVLSRIETALHLYSPGYFTDYNEPLYPLSWQNAGTEKGDGKFFRNSYLLLVLGIVTFILTVLLSGCWH